MSRAIIGDCGLNAFSDADLLKLLTNPANFFADTAKIEKLFGLNDATKARLVGILTKNGRKKEELLPMLRNALELAGKLSARLR